MAKIKIETEVSKESYEAAQATGKFLLTVKNQIADGWQMGQDLGPILASAMGDLVPGMQGIEKAGEEFKADPTATVEAFLQGLKPFVTQLLVKKAA